MLGLSDRIRNQIANSAITIEEDTKILKISFDQENNDTDALQELTAVLIEIVRERKNRSGHQQEVMESLETQVEVLKDQSMLLNWGESVKRLEPAVMVKALKMYIDNDILDKWRVCGTMIGQADANKLIKEWRKVFPPNKEDL